jgi:hypothetical protein
MQHRECGDRAGTYDRKDYRPDWMSRAARRAETSGCTMRSAPNSTRRAVTCAGPTRAAAAIAAVVLAPAAVMLNPNNARF